MARLVTAGAESKDLGVNSSGSVGVEGVLPGAGTNAPTIETTVIRSGTASFKHTATGANVPSTFVPVTTVANRSYYFRVYFQFSSLPNVNTDIVEFGHHQIRANTDGTLQLNASGTQIGSASSAVSAGAWFRVELRIKVSASPNLTEAEFRLDGALIASSVTINDTNLPIQVIIGALSALASGKIVYADDLALNDDTGTDQNSWPGDGKVVLLLPISDNAAGSWRAGSAASASANGALFNALDNTPPVGTATPDAVTACISNTVSSATTPNGDFNLTTYKSAGIGPRDIINCMQMTVVHGEDASTGAKTGSFTMLSNPASANVDTIVQFGPAAGGAVGVYPTNWAVQKGTVLYSVAAADVTQSDSQSNVIMQGPGGNLSAVAQTVSFSGDRLITQFSFNMNKVSSPTDLLTFSVQADVGGAPSGYALYSTTFDTSTLTTSTAYYAFTFPPIFLPSGSILWFIIQRNILDTTNTISINISGTLSGNLYAGGDFWDLIGSAWSINSPSRPGDAAFIMKASLPLSSVTVASSPVARITKTDTGTRAADCCFMGVYVDYTPALPKQSTFVNQSINRASTY